MTNKTKLKFVPFILSYAVVKAHISLFPSSREYFDKKFALKVIRLVFYVLQGVTVTTAHITRFIDQYFNKNICKITHI